MTVFELSEIQAQYILDTPLRRLTRYDRLELEREQDEAAGRDRRAHRILDSDERLRELVSDELAEVAKKFGTPRRTVLLEGRRGAACPRRSRWRSPTTRALVLMSATGLWPGWPSARRP